MMYAFEAVANVFPVQSSTFLFLHMHSFGWMVDDEQAAALQCVCHSFHLRFSPDQRPLTGSACLLNTLEPQRVGYSYSEVHLCTGNMYECYYHFIFSTFLADKQHRI